MEQFGVEKAHPFKAQVFHLVVFQEQSSNLGKSGEEGYVGPGWCVLCCSDNETLSHLFCHYSFFKGVWSEVCRLLNFTAAWVFSNFEDYMMGWFNSAKFF